MIKHTLYAGMPREVLIQQTLATMDPNVIDTGHNRWPLATRLVYIYWIKSVIFRRNLVSYSLAGSHVQVCRLDHVCSLICHATYSLSQSEVRACTEYLTLAIARSLVSCTVWPTYMSYEQEWLQNQLPFLLQTKEGARFSPSVESGRLFKNLSRGWAEQGPFDGEK